MKPEAQRIAIAEACGWKFSRRVEDKKSGRSWDVYEKDGRFGSVMTETLPDYLNDLNAMAEATRVDAGYVPVHNFNLADYIRYLGTLVRAEVDDDPDSGDWFLISNATASQRAEAFLRTIGKWGATMICEP